MFYAISNALKKRFVLLFQDIFQNHSVFDKVEVFTKFPKEDRPKHALLIRGVSGSSQKLGLDNFVKTIRGYSTLANLQGIPGNSIEWVRDDTKNLDKLSAPGYYIVKVTREDPIEKVFYFNVSPFLTVDDEVLERELIEGQQGAYLKNKPINPDSEVIFTDSGIKLKPDIDYSIDYETGTVKFQPTVDEFENEEIRIDYQVIGDVSEEYETEIYKANNYAVPGVIMAFGDRIRVGDEQVVVVGTEHRDVAKAYGGRWVMSIDCIGLAQDDDQQERIVDYAICSLWAEFQDRLVGEGINIYDFSLSGESEDIEIEASEEYFYTGGISFTAEIDWEIHFPLISDVRNVTIYLGSEKYKEGLSNEKEAFYEQNQFDERMLNSGHSNGFQLIPSQNTVVFRPHPPVEVRTLRYPKC